MAHRGIGLIFMCQLLGMNSNVPTDIMFSFSGFAQRACEHADGFGIAWYGERAEPGRFRDILPAWSDCNLRSLSRQIRSPLFLAHVRAATHGGTRRDRHRV